MKEQSQNTQSHPYRHQVDVYYNSLHAGFIHTGLEEPPQ